ncbi:MAG: spermidine/putrescine ABC transporter substrate-binding protein [Chloroflexi bacterium]|jgi:spermidine/putrescine transport system substrate-binding protein|nr:spermidine/putrescine ABC transporter substrate-binding protein [Chloroflexota bacterium]
MSDRDPRSAAAVILARRLAEERMTRRRFLGRAAAVGAGGALVPLLAACAGGATDSPTVAPPTGTPGPGTPAPSAEPTPVPTPEAELFVYNWDYYIGEDTVSSFQDKYGIKVTYDIFPDYETMTAKISTGNSGFDVTFPTGLDVPGFLARGLVQPLDLSLIPNKANLGADWQNPAYDPGNAHSMPYMWWTTGFAYDTEKIADDLTSWAALWDPRWKGKVAMLDDYRETFAVALMRLDYSVNTTSDAELDEALALLQQQRPLLRKYTSDDVGDLKAGNVWMSHAWSGSAYAAAQDRPSLKYVIPTEGGVRGSDTMVVLANAPHPIAAHLFIDYMLDAEVSAANTNYIGYMGPNEAAKEFIDPAILADPTVNPDEAAIDRLVEEVDLGADLEKYSSRFVTLKSGA